MLYAKDSITRSRISLDGVWNFRLLDEDEYCAAKALTDSVPMPVPSAYNDIYEGREYRDHVGSVVYERFFDLSDNAQDKDVILRFSSVTHHATVFLNGELLGKHKGGFLPFEFVITDKVKKSNNRLTVVANNIVDHGTLPCGTLETRTYPGMKPVRLNFPNFDYFNYSGIMRPVMLYYVPKTRIEAVRIKAEMNGEFSYETFLTGKAKVSAKIMDGEKVLASFEGPKASGKVSGVEAWCCENPKLYDFVVTVSDGAKVIDEYTEQFGFRTVEVKDCGLYLNGKKIYLKGFGKHEDIPVLGRGFNEAYCVKDLALMKWMGSNSFRTSHYPYSEEMMRLCDKMGILVIDETPAVGMHTTFTATGMKIGVVTPTWETLKTGEHHIDVLHDMLERDGNHPCVIMWSVANEPASEEKGAHNYFKPLFDYVHANDWQKRPVTFVTHSEATVETCEVAPLCDVLCINRYYGWYQEEGNIPAAKAILIDEMDRYHKRYPDKPILIAEFGADTVAGLHDSTATMFSEEFQRDMIQAYCEVLDSRPYFFGEHVWNFADFATAESVKRVQGNKKGVFTRDRKPKLAVWYLKERWTNKK